MKSREITKYLLVRANGDMSLRSTRPKTNQLDADQVAIPIKVTLPAGWGAVAAEGLDITIPEPPSVEGKTVVAAAYDIVSGEPEDPDCPRCGWGDAVVRVDNPDRDEFECSEANDGCGESWLRLV